MRDLYRSVWDEPAAPDPPPRSWRDWVLVGAFLAVALVEVVLRPELRAQGEWVIVVALVPTLLWRRTRPLLAVALVFGASMLVSLLARGEQPEMVALAFPLILVYALFRWGSGRAMAFGSAIIVVAATTSLLVEDANVTDQVGGAAVLGTTMALGAALRYRAGARMRELASVALVERERLARDLHDTVAHHVSAIAVRAQAGLATSSSSPDAAADALRVIEAEASRTLAEMRAMVGVLRRDEPAALAPRPGIGDIARLAARPRDGPSVEVALRGDVEDVPGAIGTAIYRLAQESVTNALRHARDATRVEVRVTADDATVRLRVRDDGRTVTGRSTTSAGFGLVGMRERAAMLGGTCRAGPDPDGGWTVTAVLPRDGATR